MHWGEWEKLIGDQKGIRRLEELFTGRGCSPASRQTIPFYSGSLKMETLQPLLETQVIANTFNTRKFFLTTWVIIKTFIRKDVKTIKCNTVFTAKTERWRRQIYIFFLNFLIFPDAGGSF